MFEHSTFESTGSIHTRSRSWMFAALMFNSSIVLLMVLIPLIHTEALPRQAMAFLMQVPPPPVTPPPAQARPIIREASGATGMQQGLLTMPRQIPRIMVTTSGAEPRDLGDVAAMDAGTGVPGGLGDAFRSQVPPHVVRQAPSAPVRISSGVAASIAIDKMLPVYPAIARAAGVQGTVVLAATISNAGSVEHLRVVSGPPMLQQAALDAVKTWRYRPYLLNGEPVEVETTVNVVFTMSR